MLDQVKSTLKGSAKPVVEFWSLSFSTWQVLAAQQTSLMTSIVSENMRFFANCRKQPGPMGIIAAQKEYFVNVNTSIMDAGTSYMRLMSETQQRLSELLSSTGGSWLQTGATFIPAEKK